MSVRHQRTHIAKLYCLLAMFLVSSSTPSPARAAGIRCVEFYQGVHLPTAQKYWPSGKTPVAGSSCSELLLSGEIRKGDYEKLVRLYRPNHPFESQIRRNSAGGDVEEAIKIGRFLRRYLITAWAPIRFERSQFLLRGCNGQNCVCASACALVWFGGVERHGSVGLHRPRTEDERFKSLSPAEASAIYRKTLSGISSYMDEMEVPKPMIETMIGTGSAEMKRVDSEKEGLERPPTIAEWIDASCGSLTIEENDTYLTLMWAIASNKQLTPEQRLLYKVLDERNVKKSTCSAMLVSSNRDSLALP